MSLNEEFDELARRKLEERQFAFREEDWQDARKRIDAQRDGRGRAAWFISAGLLLLISGWAWFGTPPLRNAPSTAAIEQGKTDQGRAASAANASAVALNTSDQTAASTAVPVVNDPNAVPADEQAPDDAMNVASITSKGYHANAGPQAKGIADHEATASKASMRTAGHVAAPAAPAAAWRHASPSNAAASVAVNNGGQPTPTGTGAERPTGEFMGNDAHQEGDRPLRSANTSNDRSTGSSKPPVVSVGARPSIDEEATSGTGAALTRTPAKEKDLAPGNKAPLPDGPTNGKTPAPASTDQTTATPTPPPADTASAPTVTGSKASAPAAAPEAAPPIVPDQAPWEIGILAGAFNSKSDYSGGNSAQWSGDISPERSLSVGAEFMHMGRNIGIGAGLHYGTYAERLRSHALEVTSTSTGNYWYLLPVDTTFLFITDTLPGQPPSYSGTSVDTTVNVLTSGTHTSTSTERLREARDQVNRVSYLEVPLLIDAHLVQGRWNLGVRGGPTFGLLTGTRGSVPSVDNEAYVEFSDLPFREFILGFTARAYVRYRFNAAWSLGIEPAIRGQLMNSLSSGDLARRSSSKGVLISLSYRLR